MGRKAGPDKNGPYELLYQDNSTMLNDEVDAIYNIIMSGHMANMHMCRRRDEYIAASRIFAYLTALFWCNDFIVTPGIVLEPIILERYLNEIIDSIETIGWQAVARMLYSFHTIEKYQDNELGEILTNHINGMKSTIKSRAPKMISPNNDNKE